MDLQQIRYFLSLAETLHFWNTAEKLFITQSALSRQIKALEEELGIQLFERSKRNVKLTEAGAFLQQQWLRLVEEMDLVHRQAKGIHEGAYGIVRIGYPGSIAYGFLPDVISNVAQALPDVKIELVEPTDISFEQLLLNHKLDIVFRRDPAENPALKSITLYAEQLALIVPSNHPMTQERFQSLADMKGERFIMSGLHHKTFYVAALRQLFDTYQFTPDVRIESDFGGTVMGLVGKGLGVSIMPSSYASSSPPNVRFIRLPEMTTLYAAWRKDDHSPVLKNVVSIVVKTAQQV